MNTIWKKYKLPIVYLGYLIVSVLLVFFVIIPTVGSIKKNSLAIQKAEADKEIFDKRIGKLDQIEEEFNEYAAKRENVGKLLEDGGEVDFIKMMEYLADETGNSIKMEISEQPEGGKDKSASKKKDADEGGVIEKSFSKEKVLVFKVGLSGNYEGLIRFLRKMEDMEYYSVISSIDVKKKSEESENRTVRASVFSFSGNNQESAVVKKEILETAMDLIVYKK